MTGVLIRDVENVRTSGNGQGPAAAGLTLLAGSAELQAFHPDRVRLPAHRAYISA
jgi:hypothetical protein